MLDDCVPVSKSSSCRVRVVLADHDPAFRYKLTTLLENNKYFEIAGEAPDADAAIMLVTRIAPQVLVLNYEIYEAMEARGLSHRRELATEIFKVVMIETPERRQIIEAFRLGAQGIILKGSAPRMWWRSIRAVVSGQYWLGAETLAVLIQAIREGPSDGRNSAATIHYGLTPREIEIVQKIAQGRSNREVGLDFSIQERTVKHHLTNIFDKVGVSSRLELALLARDQQGFTSPVRPSTGLDREESRQRGTKKS